MKDRLLIESTEIGNHRINIYYNECPSCPVSDWDMGANHIFEYLENGRYWLSRDCDWKEYVPNSHEYSVADILQRVAAEVVTQKDIIKFIKNGKVDDLRFSYNRHERQWELQWKCNYGSRNGEWVNQIEIEPSDLANNDYRDELLESFDDNDLMTLIQECAKDFVIKSWDSCGYSQGDSMRGFSYMTKKMFDKRCGFSGYYKTWQEQALAVIDGEVDCISKWAWGDVKGFVLDRKVPYSKVYTDGREIQTFEWEEVDSCWGFYMDTEELIEEVIAQHDLKEIA